VRLFAGRHEFEFEGLKEFHALTILWPSKPAQGGIYGPTTQHRP
jgi:hypothetical protein